ncbi:unnamed protein product [Linum trigynum]|uniref:Uncharacterized protein n=1 Tax=Linum trigynum TaxID=586398 RepID=A0AAV2CRG3_9ROSI
MAKSPAFSTVMIVIGSAVLYFLLLYGVALTSPHLPSKLSSAVPSPRDPNVIAKIRSAMESRGYSLAAAAVADTLRDGDWNLIEWEIQIHIERGGPITFLVPSDSAATAAAAGYRGDTCGFGPRPVMGVLCGRLRRRDFDRANGTALPSCRERLRQGRSRDAVTVTRIRAAEVEEDHARVADWSLYDDGRVVVHGIRGAYKEGMRVVLTDARRGVGIAGEGIFLPRKEWEEDARRWLLERPVDMTGCERPRDGRVCDCCRRAGDAHALKARNIDLTEEIFVF